MKAADVVVDVGCGNSPRMALIRDFNVALASGERDDALAMLADEVEWHQVGASSVEGKPAVSEWLADSRATLPTAMTIETILSHGKLASASGTVVRNEETWAMAEVYHFRNTAKTAPIVRVDSYWIRVDGE
jgi:hypothetical protein